MKNNHFSDEVSNRLGWYVYRLIDPRDGQTFYVGKGRGNRVFQHTRGEIKEDDNDILSYKLKLIKQIKNTNLDIIHIIHRHGIKDEETAFQIEAALIDAYAGLSNIMNGNGSNEFGVAHVQEIINTYEIETVEIDDKALIISINKSALERNIYDAVRFAWKISLTEAKKAELVLATIQGVIKGVFIVDEWKEATKENFPQFMLINEDIYDETMRKKRFGFVGKEASSFFLNKYINKRVPDKFRKKGASNSVKYSWKVKD